MSLAQIADEHALGQQAMQKVNAALQELGIAGIAPQLVLALYRASRCHAGLTVKSWEALTGGTNASYMTSRAADLGLVLKGDDDDDRRTIRLVLTDKARDLIGQIENRIASRGKPMERAG